LARSPQRQIDTRLGANGDDRADCVLSGLDWLEAAADGGFPCYPCFERDPNLDSLRAHPRFVRFLSAQRTQWERFKQLA
jgi:hypothetical protein